MINRRESLMKINFWRKKAALFFWNLLAVNNNILPSKSERGSQLKTERFQMIWLCDVVFNLVHNNGVSARWNEVKWREQFYITCALELNSKAIILFSSPLFHFHSLCLFILFFSLKCRFILPFHVIKHLSQLAFYVNLHRAVVGPSATLTGRWWPDIDLRRMLTGYLVSWEVCAQWLCPFLAMPIFIGP